MSKKSSLKEIRQAQEEIQRDRERFANIGIDLDELSTAEARRREACSVQACDRPVARAGLCENHAGRARLYGLTADTMAAVVSVEVCDNTGCDRPAEHIDHNHRTGIVRGHLCKGCNSALGYVDDNPERLAGLIVYLKAMPGRKRVLDIMATE